MPDWDLVEHLHPSAPDTFEAFRIGCQEAP